MPREGAKAPAPAEHWEHRYDISYQQSPIIAAASW
jgi:hypothetical protein